MKMNLCLWGLITASSLVLFNASAELEVSSSVQIHAKAEFEAPLTPYGTWVDVGSYGRCWRPVGLAVGWRPYCSGEWVWTDCGWYWASEEPWSWACYHYGWWAYDPSFGWVWVPGIDWAPAWVSWRVGGGFVGWAPLPPPGIFFAARPKAEQFVFISAGRISEPVRPSSVVVKDATIFSRTSEVGGIKRETVQLTGSGSQRAMFAHGPGADIILKATGKPLRVVSIGEAVRRTHGPVTLKVGGSGPNEKKDRGDSLPSEPDKAGRSGMPGKDHFTPPSDSSWPSVGPGNSHGNGGGGHGKGKE